MEDLSNTKPTQLLTLQQTLSGINDTTPTLFFSNSSENPNLSSSLNLNQNMKMKSPLPPLPPSRTHAKSHSLLLCSEPRSLVFDKELKHEIVHGRGKDNPDVDIMKLRRIVSNRVSAQASRLKTTQCTLDLEKEVVKFQDTIAILSPQVEIEKGKNKLLSQENDLLQKKVGKITNENKFGEKRRKFLEFEILRLKEVQSAATGYMPDPNLKLMGQPQQYPTLSFYQERLQTEQINSALKQVLSDEVISSLLDEQQSVELAADGNHEMDDDDIQQYLNYDDVNSDEITFV